MHGSARNRRDGVGSLPVISHSSDSSECETVVGAVLPRGVAADGSAIVRVALQGEFQGAYHGRCQQGSAIIGILGVMQG